MLTLETLREILAKASYPGHAFRALSKGDGFLVQLTYFEADVAAPAGSAAIEQRGRKWYVSAHAIESEVVRTLLAAALASAEHRVREHFAYDGQRIFSPHFDVEVLGYLAADGDAYERRADAEPSPPPTPRPPPAKVKAPANPNVKRRPAGTKILPTGKMTTAERTKIAREALPPWLRA